MLKDGTFETQWWHIALRCFLAKSQGSYVQQSSLSFTMTHTPRSRHVAIRRRREKKNSQLLYTTRWLGKMRGGWLSGPILPHRNTQCSQQSHRTWSQENDIICMVYTLEIKVIIHMYVGVYVHTQLSFLRSGTTLCGRYMYVHVYIQCTCTIQLCMPMSMHTVCAPYNVYL